MSEPRDLCTTGVGSPAHEPQPARSPRRASHLAVVLGTCLCSLAWYLINGRMFTSSVIFLVDKWVYSGFIFSLPSHLENFPDTYYGTRLTLIAPGYLLRCLFGPVAGDILVKVGFYLLLVLAAYALYRSRASRTAGLLAAIGILTSWEIADHYTNDYVAGAGMATCVLSLWLVELACQRPTITRWLVAGAATALIAHANLLLLVVYPPIVVYAIVRCGLNLRLAVLAGSAGLLGWAVSTATLGMLNAFWGGRFLFFMPSIEWTLKYSKFAVNPWAPTSLRWIVAGPWLLPPVLGTLSSFWTLCSGTQRRTGERARVALAAFNLLLFALFLYHYFRGNPALAFAQHTAVLQPFAIFAVVDFLWSPTAEQAALEPSAGPRETLGTMLLAFAGVLALGAVCRAITVPVLMQLHKGLLAMPLLMAVGLVIIFGPGRPDPRSAIGRLVAVALLSQVFSDREFLKGTPELARFTHRWRDPGEIPPLSLLKEVAYLHELTQEWSRGGRPAFWCDETSSPTLLVLANSVAATYLWTATILSINFPRLDKGPAGPARMSVWEGDAPLIALLPSDRPVKAGMDRLAALGIDVEIAAQQQRAFHGESYNFIAFRRRLPDAGSRADGPPVLDWHLPEQRQSLLVSRYGAFLAYRGDALATDSSGRLVFRSTTARDHLTTPFVKTSAAPRSGSSNLRVWITFDRPVAAVELPKILLQDQAYNTLGQTRPLRALEGGRAAMDCPLTTSVKEVRIVLTGRTSQPVVLPSRITVVTVKSR